MQRIQYLAIFFSFFTFFAFASDKQDDGIEAAGKYCNSLMKFSSDKSKCLAVIKNVKFVDVRAIDVCQKHAKFPSDQIKCLNAIVSKRFRDYEIEACGQESFFSDVLRCLSDAGSTAVVVEVPKPKPPQSTITVEQALETMRTVRSLLQTGNEVQAFKTLDDFLKQAESTQTKKNP